MKVLTFILSLYITALSIVPCSDGIEQCRDNGETEISVLQHEHNHSDHENDLCTPFCTCACCGSLITLPTPQLISDSKVIISTTYLFAYKFDYSFEYKEGIWHPPAIS